MMRKIVYTILTIALLATTGLSAFAYLNTQKDLNQCRVLLATEKQDERGF